jgi:pimeloyl-ACP methyl ester carboxylesterase
MLCHPQVNQAAHNPAYVRGLMGPASTLQARRDAAWIYSQGGFNVYANDLWFYSEDFNAAEHLAGLNADAFGISLLTGAYDYSASPEDSRRVAALIPGARFQAMPELGHFPMVENPQRLMDYLRPELDRLRNHGAIA